MIQSVCSPRTTERLGESKGTLKRVCGKGLSRVCGIGRSRVCGRGQLKGHRSTSRSCTSSSLQLLYSSMYFTVHDVAHRFPFTLNRPIGVHYSEISEVTSSILFMNKIFGAIKFLNTDLHGF